MRRLHSSFQLAASSPQFPTKPSSQQPHAAKPYDCCKRLQGRRLANVKQTIPSPRRKRLKIKQVPARVSFQDNGELIICDAVAFFKKNLYYFLFVHIYYYNTDVLM